MAALNTKPRIHKHKTARGRITGYSAEMRGFLSDVAKTPAAAKIDLDRQITAALARVARGPLVTSSQGATIFVAPCQWGWRVWHSELSSTSFQGNTRDSTREEAVLEAETHIAQLKWSHTVPDDHAYLETVPSSVRDRTARHIAWQRAYRETQQANPVCDDVWIRQNLGMAEQRIREELKVAEGKQRHFFTFA